MGTGAPVTFFGRETQFSSGPALLWQHTGAAVVPAFVVREEDGVWWITFDRPEASNAFTLADLDRLSEIFEEGGDRPRAAVLTGAGQTSFSAGMPWRRA